MTTPTPAPPPRLLDNLDWTAVAWAAGWALVYSLVLAATRHREEVDSGKKPANMLTLLTETVLGGLVGGVLFSLAIPEQFTWARGAGKQALLSIAGAITAPYLRKWGVAILAAGGEAWVQKRFGVKVDLQGPTSPAPPPAPAPGGADHEDTP